jgi:O-antigen/teichoic acid export membrane protein
MQVLSFWALRRCAPELSFGLRDSRRAQIRPIASYSWSLVVTNVARRLETKTDEVVIGAFLALSAVTTYALARRMAEASQILTEQFRKLLLPMASELNASDDRQRLRLLYTVGTRLTLAIYVPLGGTLAILAVPILSVWVGSQYADQGYLVAILTAASLIMTSQRPGVAILQGIAKHRPLAWMIVSSGVGNLVLSVLLVQRFGLVGVAVGTLVPTAVVYSGLVLRYTLQTLDIRLASWLGDVVWPTAAPAVPAAAVLFALRPLLAAPSLPVLVVVAAAGLLTYALVYLAIGAADFERNLLRSLAHNTLRVGGD